MDDNQKDYKEVRHTISAEETFTLAKDVFDLRCLIKSIYNNRAQISRRLNNLSLVSSIVFTLLYIAYMLFSGLFTKLEFAWEVAIYSILGAYGVLTILLLIVTFASNRNQSTKNLKSHGKLLKFFRYCVRIASLAMAIAALAVSATSGGESAIEIAVQTVAIIVSIVFIILSAIPLLCGGLGGMARWLLSPTKIKRRFTFVVLEWYRLLQLNSSSSKATKNVSAVYINDIGRCVDEVLIPALGKKYMSSIGINNICAAINKAQVKDRDIVEGILKNVFDYACECGYVTFNPCKDMGLVGSIEIEEKPAKEPLKVRIGKKVGSKVLSKFLGTDKSEKKPKDKKKK